MNVVQREKNKNQPKFKNELLRRDTTNGIRGSYLLPITNASRVPNQMPRYQFYSHNESAKTNKSSMGPPLGPSRSLKRKLLTNSMSSRPESSTSGRARPKVLASDSAAVDTSMDVVTPKNRPVALRYISSSSKGCYSATRSARSSSTVAIEASVILAISEGRGMARGEIGLAAIDLRHPNLVLCQFSDTLLYTHTLTKINFFNPIEIIVPHTFYEGVQPNQLYQLIRDQYPQVKLNTVQRRFFNDASGRLQIQTLCAPEYKAVYLQVLPKFYALTAAAAILKYVECIQCIVFSKESLKIEYHSSESTMIIDVGTATQLELVQPLVPSAGHTCCLLGVLGPMYTVGGIRALRASILQPSCNKEFIENRLDAIQDLIDNDQGLMVDLQDVIKKLADIDKILFLCIEFTNQNIVAAGEAQLNQTLLLKTTMELVPKLVEALQHAESGRLRKIKMDFENPHYTEIADRIRNIIQEDAHMEKGVMGSYQRCFAVKPNINGLLDVARRTYSELIEDIQKIVEQLGETYDLQIRLNQNTMKGFHIVLPVAPKNRNNFNVEDLPPIFIQVQNNGTTVTMTTEELVVLDQQSKESLQEIQKMSNIVISSLLKELRPFMPSLYKLCEDVAELDILVALANASSIGSYIRPEFNDYLDIKNSVHPLLDYNSQVMPVPNDIFASPEHNFTIITGPNMGGKSIYIKQIAIMQVMAQLGCFLPATNAVLRLCDRLYSRIGFNDSVELNASTFVYEMKEIQHIIKGVTKSSLVIIDELCRGTNVDEGTSIAWAICEELIASDAFTFFTTHFTYVTKLQELYFSVVNFHATVLEKESEDGTKKVIYTHKIEPGISKVQNYGLTLASKTHLHEDTVKLAIELSKVIACNEMPQEIRTPQQNDEAIVYKLNADLNLESQKHGYSEDKYNQMLQKFKNDNPDLLQRIKYQNSSNNKTDCTENYSSVDSIRHDTSSDIRTYPIQGNNDTENKASSVTISITKDPSPNPYDFEKNHQTAVKSSTELLHSIVNADNDSSAEREQLSGSEKYEGRYSQIDISVNTREQNSSSLNEIQTDTAYRADRSKMLGENDVIDITDASDSDSAETVSNIFCENDANSVTADALTQVIEECSLDEPQTKNKCPSTNSMSLDEDFISEVVNEINEELEIDEIINISDLILTPPIGFRND